MKSLRGAWTITVSSLALVFVSSVTSGQPASDAAMARSALESAFRTSDPYVLDQRVQAAGQELSTRVLDSQASTNTVMGIVVFTRGVSSSEIENLSNTHEFEIVSAEAKIPIGQSGEVVTMSAGSRDLVLLGDLPLSQQLRFATGALRYRLLQSAMVSESDLERELLLEGLKDPDPKYYKVTIVADLRTFGRLRNLDWIAVVVPDRTASAADAHRAMVEDISAAKLGPPVTRTGTLFERSLPRPVSNLADEPSEVERR